MQTVVTWAVEYAISAWIIIWLILLMLTAVAGFLLWKLIKSLTALTERSEIGDTARPSWHTEAIDEIFDRLDATPAGLTSTQAAEKLLEYGANRLPEPKRTSLILRFCYQFHNVLIYVLIVAAAVTAVLGHHLDAGIILAVVILNALIGFLQEGKAESALKAIRKMLSAQAMVRRDGRQQQLPAEALTPGDIVLLQAGDKVSADMRLFDVKGLKIQESMLTGESLPVTKTSEPVDAEAVLGDRFCMAYSGTLVTHGQAAGVVVVTGVETEIGRISTMVAQVQSVTTPLLLQMQQFGRWLTLVILAIAGLTFAFGLLVRDYAAAEMFLAAVSLAVAAIPEGLPAIMSITLAIGVQRMARQNAIIRKLPAVETLGAVSVICTDKTGTLTRNEMTVRTIVTAEHEFELHGIGYLPQGSIMSSDRPLSEVQLARVREVALGALLCNESSLERRRNEWLVHGDPMEGALLIAALKAGLDLTAESQHYTRTDLIPFDSDYRYMATLHHNHQGEGFIFVKGAPERLLAMAGSQRCSDGDRPLTKDFWLEAVEQLAAQGQRVLAIAAKPARQQQLELTFGDVESGLVLLALFGLMDPPRAEAIASVHSCATAGIRVKMITGDHAATACAIGRRLNLTNADDVLTGQDLELLSDRQLREQAMAVDIYARVNPEHKLRLVGVLQEQGLIVAMTGDGVNDAPALKRADVGAAMGKIGSEAAKEAAEMVLADDNFASITHAVEQGRTVYDNLKKAILFILPSSGGEALIILASIVFGLHQLPLTPVQILWVNMVTTVTLALVLGFEPTEADVMRRPPRDPRQPLLTGYLVWRVVFVALVMMAGTMGLFLWEMEQGATIEHARTVAVNTLVVFEIFYLFNSRYITASVLNWAGLTGNRYILIAISILLVFQLAFTYWPAMQSLFGTTAIDYAIWPRIIVIASSVLFLVEIEKYFVRRLGWAQH